LYGDNLQSDVFRTPFEVTTSVVNYLSRQQYKTKLYDSIPTEADILQLSLATLREGYSGGPIFTQGPDSQLIGIVFAATPDQLKGLGASADDIRDGLEALRDVKRANGKIDKNGWITRELTETKPDLPRDNLTVEKSAFTRSALTVIGADNKNPVVMDQEEFVRAVGGTDDLRDVLVEKINFKKVVLNPKKAGGAGPGVGKGVTFFDCGLNGLIIKGGDVSLLRFVACQFDANFLRDGFQPDLGYGVEFIVQDKATLELVRDYWREGKLSNYVEVQVTLDSKLAMKCRGTVARK
jgi:hypothetical protein